MMKFRNAGPMGHFGSKEVAFRARDAGRGRVMSLGFQLGEVQKLFAAVWRIAERGSVVRIGPREGDNFIRGVKTGQLLKMKRMGRSYVLEVQFAVEAPTRVVDGEFEKLTVNGVVGDRPAGRQLNAVGQVFRERFSSHTDWSR